MTRFDHVPLTRLSTGIAGLDAVLGGGLPEFSFNLINGPPGAGKTTLAHQMMFAAASPERPALYFTVLGESPIKMLRYQQQMTFFDPDKVGSSIRFINLNTLVGEQGLSAVLKEIIQQVEDDQPGIVVVDSFQAMIRTISATNPAPDAIQNFVQRLAVHLAVAHATTFLIGEQLDDEPNSSAVLTIADGIFALSQIADQNSVVRKLQVVKSRGIAAMPGLHTFRITQDGVRVFPRISLAGSEKDGVVPSGRMTSGIPGLDAMLGGGIPYGDAVVVSGPSGAGKSMLATQFIAAGCVQGEPGVIIVFEEHPQEYMRRAETLGLDLAQMERDGTLKILYLRPLDLSPDETLHAICAAADQIGAKRVVIDSLSGFELALAATFRADFRESMYRLVNRLTGLGMTVLMTMEITETFRELRLSPYIISFLADTIILLRYVELTGQLAHSLMVIKMRNSSHSRDMRRYELTAQGMIVRDNRVLQPGTELAGGGIPRGTAALLYPGLTAAETIVLQALIQLPDVTTDELSDRTGLAADTLISTALDRLISLNYAVRLEHGSDPARYRAVTQPFH
ncbi:MAG: AAA family ATPase [Herpetosiphonaceae bacterium]|nr:AAA family ATPase [Herpetosiphonaceae bacterium]